MSTKDPPPTATTRVSIQWDNEAPEEHTSTLVLTAPSGIFVDLRVFTEGIPSDKFAHERQQSSAIDWAFAGMSTHRPSSSGADLTESTWMHWVDSRTADALGVPDSGVSSPLPNGDTSERGAMKDASGVVRSYEEIWRDGRVVPACAAVFIRFRDGVQDSEPTTTKSGPHKGVESIDPHDVCGVLIRMGSWCQGVLRDEHGFTAERWELLNASAEIEVNLPAGSWAPVFRSGKGGIPCLGACSTPCSLDGKGSELDTPSGRWKCVEVHDGTSGQSPSLDA